MSLVRKHLFSLNPNDNGGENVSIETKFFDNGDDKDNIYLNTEISSICYGTSTTNLLLAGSATLTPEKLRKLADEIEEVLNELKK